VVIKKNFTVVLITVALILWWFKTMPKSKEISNANGLGGPLAGPGSLGEALDRITASLGISQWNTFNQPANAAKELLTPKPVPWMPVYGPLFPAIPVNVERYVLD